LQLLILLIALAQAANPTPAPAEEPVPEAPSDVPASPASEGTPTPSTLGKEKEAVPEAPIEVPASERTPAPPTFQKEMEYALPPVPETSAKKGEHHFDWLAVPIITYDSDYKLGYGAAAQFQWAGEVDPYRHEIAVQVLFSTGGYQSHFINYNAPRFLGTPLRLWAHVELNKEAFAPYYGLGNVSSSAIKDHPTLFGTNPFTFDVTRPLARLGFAYPLSEHVFAYFFTTVLSEQIRVASGSLLAVDNPSGIAGGHELQFLVGLYRNTRDNEATPNRGSLLGLSFRGAIGPLWSSYTYGGLNAQVLGFVPVLKRLVLAMRLEGDLLSQGTPFFELSQFGGLDHVDGIGGHFSARGIPEDRYIGRGKVIGTVEARLRLVSPMMRGEPLSFGIVAFTDAGRAWQFDGNDGPWYKIHLGYGGGLRVWRRAFVLRVDVATSTDRPFNIYVLFGHFF
jgi:hypothetical protein